MRIAILGFGSIGKRHLGNLDLREHEVLLYDKVPGTAVWDRTTGKYIEWAENTQQIWDWKPEAVLICTPPDSHLQLAEESVEHGVKGLFIEKPLALALDGCKELACRRWDSKAITMIACQTRWHVGPTALKRWLSAGEIGEVISAQFQVGYYLPDTRKDYKTAYTASTGATLDVGSHAVDAAVWLLGDVKLLAARTTSATSIGLPSTDGAAEMMLQHASGAISSINISWLQRDYSQRIRISGTLGTCCWDWEAGVAWLECGTRRRYGRGDDVSYNIVEEKEQMYARQLKYFLECVKEGKATSNPVSAAVKMLKLLLEARK